MTATESPLAPQLERFRVERTGHSYRMLGSSHDAEDAVQDTMVRAWRSYDKFEGRSSPRSWLYRIATNGRLDPLAGGATRGRPPAGDRRPRRMDLSESTPLAQAALSPRPDNPWLEPMPDSRVLPTTDD